MSAADRAITQRRLSLINPQVDIVMHLDHQHLILLIPSCASEVPVPGEAGSALLPKICRGPTPSPRATEEAGG